MNAATKKARKKTRRKAEAEPKPPSLRSVVTREGKTTIRQFPGRRFVEFREFWGKRVAWVQFYTAGSEHHSISVHFLDGTRFYLTLTPLIVLRPEYYRTRDGELETDQGVAGDQERTIGGSLRNCALRFSDARWPPSNGKAIHQLVFRFGDGFPSRINDQVWRGPILVGSLANIGPSQRRQPVEVRCPAFDPLPVLNGIGTKHFHPNQRHVRISCHEGPCLASDLKRIHRVSHHDATQAQVLFRHPVGDDIAGRTNVLL